MELEKDSRILMRSDNLMLDKPLPCDVQAERAILSCIFRDNDVLNESIGVLGSKDFSSPVHAALYRKMANLYTKDQPIDLVTLCSALGDEFLSQIGGITYLSGLINEEASPSLARNYMGIIKELAQKRIVIKNCLNAINNAYDKEKTAHDTIDELETTFMGISNIGSDDVKNAYEIIEYTMLKYNENKERGGKVVGVSTGYKIMDNMTGGMTPKDYWVVGARPSMGKTAFMLSLINNMPSDKKCMLIEMDTSDEKVGFRILSALSLQNLKDVSRGNLNEQGEELLYTKGKEFISKDNFYMSTKAGQTVSQIRSKARKIKLKYGLDVLFIDHIGKIRPKGNATGNEALTQISKDLKELAMDLNVTVVALSQLNRKPDERPDHHPIMSDLRDSGSIEQDADIILFLYRDDYYALMENRDSEAPDILEITAAKNRDGEVGTATFVFNGEYQKITEKPKEEKVIDKGYKKSKPYIGDGATWVGKATNKELK